MSAHTAIRCRRRCAKVLIARLCRRAYIPGDVKDGETTMDRMVARLNIQHYEQSLEKETNAAKRDMLRRLLSEEREKLRKAELDYDRKRKRD